MAKKRKTPSAPRSAYGDITSRKTELPGARVIGLATHDRDTDEQQVGEFHPGFGFEDDEDSGETQLNVPAVIIEDELLDLGPLREEKLDAGAYAPTGLAQTDGQLAGDDEQHERRLTPTLLKIFARRREQIRLSLDQLSRLSGISLVTLEALDRGRPGTTITYDQTVVLSRVLGVGVDELPGLRTRETRSHLGVVLAELERTMLSAPLLRFEGQHGERYGGDVERAASSKSFTVRIEDESLEPSLSKGSLLGFMNGVRPRPGGILLLRHRRSALLAMRRNEPPSYVGVVPWQPAYVIGGEWHLVGSLEVVLPPR